MPELVLRILRADLSLDVPGADAELLATGLLDSLALVDLLARLEQEIGVKIPLDRLELDDLRTPERIAAMVERLRVQVP